MTSVPTFKAANFRDPNTADAGRVFQTARDLPDDVERFPLPFVKTSVAQDKSNWLLYSQNITISDRRGPNRESVLVGLRDTLRGLVNRHGPIEVGMVASDKHSVKVFVWVYPNTSGGKG